MDSRSSKHPSKHRGVTMNVIHCYAPTNEDDKDQFYERRQSTIEKRPRDDLTILIEDLNFK
ncbi:unnamed protein product, partial [Schistosoma intercalatum]